MNQKALRYFLFAGLALVWGTIIYRVISGLGSNDTIVPVNKNRTKMDYTTPMDSFSLLADYPDPFLHTENDSTSYTNPVGDLKNENIIATDKTQPVKPAFDITKIQYRGMIVNPDKKKKVAIISIAGKEYMAKEKEKVEEIWISRITKGEITILINGKTEQVRKHLN